MKFDELTHHATVTHRGPPRCAPLLPPSWNSAMPDYRALLSEANGLEVHGGLFRLFGAGEGCLGRDAIKWNAGAWRTAYKLADTLVFWGENIFGDEFGYDLASKRLVIVRCEGGQVDALASQTIAECLHRLVFDDPETWIEMSLVRGAFASGLHPSAHEHLSFGLPLICGGAADVSNLEVLEGEAHLEILGQLLEQGRELPEGTKIGRFTDVR